MKFLLPFGEKVRMRGKCSSIFPPHPIPLPLGRGETTIKDLYYNLVVTRKYITKWLKKLNLYRIYREVKNE
jgi:hypothetical protein